MRQKFFGWLAHLITHRRGWIIGVTLAIFFLLLIPLRHVQFSTDVLELIPQELEVLQTFRELDRHFVQGGDFVVLIEASTNDSTTLDLFQHHFTDELGKLPDIISVTPSIGGKVDPASWRWLWDRFWLALEPRTMDALIAKLQPDAITNAVHRARIRLETAPSGILAQQVTYDPLGLSEVFVSHLQSVFSMTGSDLAASTAEGAFQILNIETRTRLTDSHACMRMVDEVRQAEQRARLTMAASNHNGSHWKIGYTGRIAFTAEIARKMRFNMFSNALLSLVLVLFLFWLGFRSLYPLMGIASSLLITLACTISICGMFFGGFNLITGSFASILVGLGVDYGILIYNRYSLAVKVDPDQAVRQTLEVTVPGIYLGSITTAIAFLAVVMTSSPGFRQFGFVVPIGIMLCAVMMTGFFFALLTRRKVQPVETDIFTRMLTRLGGWLPSHHRTVLIASALLIAVAAGVVFSGKHRGVGFDADPNSLRFRNSEAFDTLYRIFARLNRSLSSCALLVSGGDWKEVARQSEALTTRAARGQKEGWIQSYETPSGLMPSPERQQANMKRLGALDWVAIRESFQSALRVEGFRAEEFSAMKEWLDRAAAANTTPESAWLTPAHLLQSSNGNLLRRYLYEGTNQFQAVTYVYPVEPLKTRQAIDNLITKLDVDGHAIRFTNWDALILDMQPVFRRDFVSISAVVLVVVVVLVWMEYRRVGPTLLALLPLGGALFGMLAMMKLFGIKFNLANFFAVPIVIGAGVDYGIHILNAFREPGSDCGSVVRITGKAVLLNALTTAIGFGSLILTAHTGLSTLGLMTGVGILLCLVISLVTLPVCMTLRKG